jgi:hypothetical protein
MPETEAEAKARKASNEADAAQALAEKAQEEKRKAAAEADAAEAQKVLPTFASIAEPTDKSIKVEDKGGAGVAELLAARAAQRLGISLAADVYPFVAGREFPREQRKASSSNTVLNYYNEDERPANRLPPPVGPDGRPFVVCFVDSTVPAAADLARQEVKARLDDFRDRFAPPDGEITPASIATGVTIATGAAKFGLELLSAIRRRFALYSRDVTPSRTALLAATGDGLLSNGVGVRWPQFTPVSEVPIIKAFAATASARDAYAQEHLATKPDDEAGKERYERAKKLVDEFDAYAREITTDPEGADRSRLVEAAFIEMTYGLPDSKDLFLIADISGKGAEGTLGYGVIKGSSAAFLGWVQVYYVLSDRAGSIKATGTLTYHMTADLELGDASVSIGSTNVVGGGVPTLGAGAT